MPIESYVRILIAAVAVLAFAADAKHVRGKKMGAQGLLGEPFGGDPLFGPALAHFFDDGYGACPGPTGDHADGGL